jgi:hypothetical protein
MSTKEAKAHFMMTHIEEEVVGGYNHAVFKKIEIIFKQRIWSLFGRK